MKLFRKKANPIRRSGESFSQNLRKEAVLFREVRDGHFVKNLLFIAKTQDRSFFTRIGTLFATVPVRPGVVFAPVLLIRPFIKDSHMYSPSTYRSSLVRGLLVLGAVATAQIASAGDWVGYMNVFNNASGSQGSYVFGSGWGVSDLKTTISNSNAGTIIGDQLILEPNYNTYTDSLSGNNADRAFWTNSSDGGVTPGPLGNKWMNASTFVETPNLAIPSYTLAGNVTANTLNTGLYTAKAFIKVLDPGAGYATILNDSVTLPASGPFIVSSNLSLLQGKLLQVGFSMDGINGNPIDAVTNGSVSVSVVPEPSTLAVLAAAGCVGAIASRRRRKA